MLERHSASYGWSAPTEGRTVSIVCRIALPDGWTQLRVGPAQGAARWTPDRYVNLTPDEARALIEEIAADLPPAIVYIVRAPAAVAAVAFKDREQAERYESQLPAAVLERVEILDRRRAQAVLQPTPRVVRCPSC